MTNFLIVLFDCACATLVACGLLGALLALLPRCGRRGTAVIEQFSRAPLLDATVAAFTWLPWVIGACVHGWTGVFGALLGQAVLLPLWCMGHEFLHVESLSGPRIVKFLNRTVGRWQNHLALWVTLIALPGFWIIRAMELFAYWPLVWLLNFPRYKQSEWINVSRQKFEGLIGHDLVWCLYCDWMTGVYSLGAEMLRNVESFWCPIRFYDGKKCENCRTDFPDIDRGWVQPGGSMADVQQVMEAQYGAGRREWFNHPARLTVKGQDIQRNV